MNDILKAILVVVISLVMYTFISTDSPNEEWMPTEEDLLWTAENCTVDGADIDSKIKVQDIITRDYGHSYETRRAAQVALFLLKRERAEMVKKGCDL